MADNFTNGGVTFRSDDVGGGIQVQIVKNDAGGDGASIPLIADATIAGLPTEVRKRRVTIQVTPTVTSGSGYLVGDAVGGLMTFPNAARVSALTGAVRSVGIVDKGQQRPGLDLVLFSASVASVTDNSPFDPTDLELATFVHLIHLPSLGGWGNFNDNAAASVACCVPYECAATSLFGVLVLREIPAPTFTSTSDVIVTLRSELD